MRFLIFIFALFALPAHAGEPERLSGMATVVDGDTIVVNEERLRLHGIDAPELEQLCYYGTITWRCGVMARAALVDIIFGQEVDCDLLGRGRYGRAIAVCRSAEGVNINSFMVGMGWALAYRRYSTEYVDLEEAARSRRLGVWVGTLEAPWDWRRNHG